MPLPTLKIVTIDNDRSPLITYFFGKFSDEMYSNFENPAQPITGIRIAWNEEEKNANRYPERRRLRVMLADAPNDAVMLFYDVRNEESLNQVKQKVEHIKANFINGENLPLYLIGMHSNNIEDRPALEEKAQIKTGLTPLFVTSLFTVQEASNILERIKAEYLNNANADVREQINNYREPSPLPQ